jgi:Do/DeqQ family serine protease
MKKKNLLSIAVILIVGMMLGGAFVSQYGSLAAVKNLLPAVDQTAQSTTQPAYKTAADAITIGPTNIADMVEKVSPAVVNIEATVKVQGSNDPYMNDPFFRDFFGNNSLPQSQTEKSIGTGFVITDSGYILTNYHVVQDASSINVKIVGVSKALTASVVGYDDQLDLAVLKIGASNKLPYLALGNSDNARVGDWVVAIGNPYGLDHTVTAGVISAKGRPMTIEGRSYKNLIQTDAAINPGNSGGPLLNTSGQVIAINTAINAEAQGIGFAIPINTARDVLDQLINNGKVSRPYMGVYLSDLTDQMAEYLGASGTDGALVTDVASGTPAAKAGLRKGDIILTINGDKVTDASDLTDKVLKYKVSQKVTLGILRDQKQISVSLVLAEKP